MRKLSKSLSGPAIGVFLGACALVSSPVSAEESGWLEARTAFADLYSQTSPERAHWIARDLDLFRAVFQRLGAGLSVESPVPTQIFAFRDAEAFAPYRTVPQARGVRVMGQMIAHRDANYILLDAGAPIDEALSVVIHEYVHYLVRHNFPRAPRWFNEGLAEYYSTFSIEGDRAVLGRPVERHLRWLARHELDLGEVLQNSLELDRRHAAGEVGNFYAGSWALVHYLLSGGAARAEALGEFLASITDGADPQAALEDAFELRVSDLEGDVHAAIAKQEFPVVSVRVAELDGSLADPTLSRVPSSRIDAALAAMSSHMGKAALAERHADSALDADGRSGAAYGVLARLRADQGRIDEAESLYLQAVTVGSESPATYLDYARFMLAEQLGEATEEERPGLLRVLRGWLDEAERRAPYFAEVDAVRGYSYLFSEGSMEPGIAALRRARREMPERMDLALHESQLWMKAARFDEAERIIERTMAAHAEPELLAVAREELERRRLLYDANVALADGDLESGMDYLDHAISITSDPHLAERLELQLLELQRQSRLRSRR